jgi:hypothetical protein
MPNLIKKHKEQWIIKESLDQDLIEKYFRDPSFKPIDPLAWEGRIFHQRRQFADGQLIFFANFDSLETGSFEIEIKAKSK